MNNNSSILLGSPDEVPATVSYQLLYDPKTNQVYIAASGQWYEILLSEEEEISFEEIK